jgi:PIN domain nuclease of toxin-antitoxin system
MAIVLDTCAWLWLCSEPDKLSKAAHDVIRRETRRSGLVVSVFSAWEIAKLVQKGKLRFAISCRDWIDGATRMDGVTMHPLTPEICVESTELPGAFPGDPADQIIVATARTLSAPVVTGDRKILDYAHVPTIW